MRKKQAVHTFTEHVFLEYLAQTKLGKHGESDRCNPCLPRTQALCQRRMTMMTDNWRVWQPNLREEGEARIPVGNRKHDGLDTGRICPVSPRAQAGGPECRERALCHYRAWRWLLAAASNERGIQAEAALSKIQPVPGGERRDKGSYRQLGKEDHSHSKCDEIWLEMS